jgi:hypothetical protein
MPNTTNFNFPTPADSDLVKDGALAIRNLGNSIDTAFVDLKGGTSGQYLSKNSNTDLDYTWVTPTAGGLTLISETTASAISSLSLSSIPSTYKQLYLTWHGIFHSTSGNFFNIRLNNNSTAGTYRTKQLGFSGNTVQSDNNSNTELYVGASYLFGSEANWTTELEKMVKGYLIIDNYASSTKKKLVTGWVGYAESGQERWSSFVSTFNSTTAISSIDVFRAGGSGTFSNATDTSIRLYGIS